MSDLVAALIVIGLAVERGLAEWLHARERRYLINAAIADTPGELRVLEHKLERRREAKPTLPEGFENQVGA